MKYRSLLIVLVLIFAAASAIGSGMAAPPTLLVDAAWLEENSSRENVVIIDFGRALEDYEAGHIPGARYIDRSAVYDTVNDVSGMLPTEQQAVPHFEKAGIDKRSLVVIYDAIGGLWASRLFWGLEYFGHKKVYILDGGLPAWEESGRALSQDVPSVEPADFAVKLRPELVANSAYILGSIDDPSIQVIDSRSVGEYRGSDVRAERGGHIPGAINIDWALNLDENRSFLSLQDLNEFYDSSDIDKGKTQVAHCQTGVRGAHTYFVLRYLGYKNVKLYDESWVVWGNNPDAPIEAE